METEQPTTPKWLAFETPSQAAAIILSTLAFILVYGFGQWLIVDALWDRSKPVAVLAVTGSEVALVALLLYIHKLGQKQVPSP